MAVPAAEPTHALLPLPSQRHRPALSAFWTAGPARPDRCGQPRRAGAVQARAVRRRGRGAASARCPGRHTERHIGSADVLADVVGPPTLDALAARITAQPYTLLHVVCHGTYAPGTGETLLFLAGSNNQVEVVTASRLIERLRTIQGARGLPHLAFLATCDSAAPEAEAALGGLGQRLVRELGMPAVVAMTERVSVDTADALAGGFYSRLREHGEVDRALAEATAGLAGRFDVTVPGFSAGWPAGRYGVMRWIASRPRLRSTEAWISWRACCRSARRSCCRNSPPRRSGCATRSPRTAAVLSASANKERLEAQAGVNALSEEVLDLSFNGLCFGRQPPPYDARCPFPGLVAFDADASEFFFGREPLIAQLATKLAGHNLLPVLGPSGCGKSSLVLAGLAPVLRGSQPGLQVAILRPGSDPLAQMDQALVGLAQAQNEDTLLIVDQFEELFTLTQDAGQRQTFIERLLAESRSRRVVLTMRGDFLDDCAAYAKLYAALQSHLQLIAPMSPAELRSAMEQQAGAVGLRFEADLANTILDDVAGEPGAMPLLQHALLELWKRRHGRWLRATEYRAMGGVQGAIARTAEGVYTQLAGHRAKPGAQHLPAPGAAGRERPAPRHLPPSWLRRVGLLRSSTGRLSCAWSIAWPTRSFW